MQANDIVRDERVMRIREMKDEISRLKAEISRLSAAYAAIEHHVALAALAASDAARLPPGGDIVILDGWNIILGARPHGAPPRRISDRQGLLAAAATYAKSHPSAFLWIVYDGAEESAAIPAPHVRVSYTGGDGAQRADRLILDFLRMLSLSGQDAHTILVTADRALSGTAAKLKAKVISPDEFLDIR